jgi:prepilin-type N-terminal cleavage/methylation domain-containing protein/prepilin-type processing-associated H-X9-DG protein
MSLGLRRTYAGFTLIELLVVIGIIAVLVAILLPTLNNARRQAAMVQCQSNMKQVAMGMMLYIDAHKGRFPAAGIPPLSADFYPYGFWWANELVRGKFINNPSINVYAKPGSLTSEKRFNRSNPFRCPEGVDEDQTIVAPNFPSGEYPTDPRNNGYTLINDAKAAEEGFGVPSWYQLNSRVVSPPAVGWHWPGGHHAAPFVWFNTGHTQVNHDWVLRNDVRRVQSYVKKSAELIMVVEAPNPNWYDQAQSNKYPGLYLKRLAARHGKKSANGANAWTNFAFFDGHVALYPTADYNQGPVGNEQWPPDKFWSGTIFWLANQTPK